MLMSEYYFVFVSFFELIHHFICLFTLKYFVIFDGIVSIFMVFLFSVFICAILLVLLSLLLYYYYYIFTHPSIL